MVLQTFTASDFEEMKVVSHGLDEARTVCLVRHKSSSLTLLKKIIHKDPDPQVIKQIYSEIEILHRCNHPNVVHFFGAFLSDKGDEVHIVMEYMNAGCLDSMRRRIGRFREQELGAIVYRALKGMRDLNNDHVVHRDIKPSNILVNTKGEVKLCDFGVSKIMLDKSTRELKFKTFVGTLMYMSPERLEGQEYTHSCDIWSLGMSILELAMGYHPLAMRPPYPPPREIMDPRAPGWTGDKRSPAHAVPFEILQDVTKFQGFQLPKPMFSDAINDFCDGCLVRAPEQRTRLGDLLQHKWVVQADRAVSQRQLAEYVRMSLKEDPMETSLDDEEEVEEEELDLATLRLTAVGEQR